MIIGFKYFTILKRKEAAGERERERETFIHDYHLYCKFFLSFVLKINNTFSYCILGINYFKNISYCRIRHNKKVQIMVVM